MGTWQLDPMHTQVEFAVKHFGMMTVRGQFTDVRATGTVDPEHPEDSHVEVTVGVASLSTHNGLRRYENPAVIPAYLRARARIQEKACVFM